MNTTISSFRFIQYYVKNATININIEKLKNSGQYSINIVPDGKIVGNTFSLHLNINIKAEGQGFDSNVEFVGIFEFEDSVSQVPAFFVQNAPAILFPYVRAYLSSLTALSGMSPIILPTLNLENIAQDLEKKLAL